MQFEEFTDLLYRKGDWSSGYGQRLKFHCPAHDDSSPSLSVKDGEDRVLVYCHAGCSIEAITEALGIKVSDLFYDQEFDVGKEVASYVYTDEHGAYLYERVRYDPKRFAIRTKQGWGLSDTRRTLYRLPDVVKAVRRGEVVWIVEGEKDVESLRRIGVCGTTAGGSGQWHFQFPRFFVGAEVVVCFDRDEAGRKAAREVAESLRGIAKTIRIAEVAYGNDISDHLQAGYKLKEVKCLALANLLDRKSTV